MMKLLLLLSAFVVTSHASTGGSWNYNTHDEHNGPEHWPSYCHSNSGRQSPINVFETTPNDGYEAFNFDGYDGLDVLLFNPGNTVEVEIEHGYPILSGGGLPGSYKLLQFHWHWGSQDGTGSEHLVEGKSKSMEVHFVHVKMDGSGPPLAVISWLIEVDVDSSRYSDRESEYQYLFSEEHVSAVSQPLGREHGIHLDHINAMDYMGDVRGDFFRYDGGLTTPNCDETVIWTVFKDPILIHPEELELLRSYVLSKRAKDPFSESSPYGFASDNNRPLQSRNGRPIYLYENPNSHRR